MALPTQTIAAVQWQTYGSDATNLAAVTLCDFTTYGAYTFNPVGIFRQSGTVRATGMVIDNLLSSSPVSVMIGPLVETVPAYTKNTFQLTGDLQVTVMSQQSRIYVTFFYGTYGGTTGGTNYYLAQLAAGLAVETGFISMYAGASSAIPTGYLLCDGSEISRSTYQGLFTIIGTLYGTGNGSTTFNLPDFRGRMAVGAGSGTGLTTRALASQGGAEAVTLTATMMPVHTHALNDPGHNHGTIDPGHQHNWRSPNGTFSPNLRLVTGPNVTSNWTQFVDQTLGFSGRPYYQDPSASEGYTITNQGATTGISINSATTGITIKYAGGAGGTGDGSNAVTQPSPNMPPYTAINFVIKT